MYRISRQEVFCKKGVLRNFAKFTRKHLCQSLFFNKVAGVRTLELKKPTDQNFITKKSPSWEGILHFEEKEIVKAISKGGYI